MRRGGLRTHSLLTAASFARHFSDVHDEPHGCLSADQQAVADNVTSLVSRLAASSSRTTCVSAKLVSADLVAQLLCRLKRGTAPGPDGVTVEHLIFCNSPELLRVLAFLLSACLRLGAVPSSFANSTIVPLLKRRVLTLTTLTITGQSRSRLHARSFLSLFYWTSCSPRSRRSLFNLVSSVTAAPSTLLCSSWRPCSGTPAGNLLSLSRT